MDKRIFSIRDVKTGVFGDPVVVPHLAVLIRQLTEVASDPKTVLAKFPEDFQVFEIGGYVEDTGCLLPLANPTFILNVTELTRKDVSNV